VFYIFTYPHLKAARLKIWVNYCFISLILKTESSAGEIPAVFFPFTGAAMKDLFFEACCPL